MIDDEHLRRGVYDLRAVAVNGAGLQQGTDRRQDGLPARIKLPVRAASHLVAGRSAGRRCHRSRGHRVCRATVQPGPARAGRPLEPAPRPAQDRAARPSSGASRCRSSAASSAPSSGSRCVRSARRKSGRFRYRARRGPARTIRFRYPGTPTIRGDNAPVKLQVAASTTMRGPRRAVVNGEYATFRGRLRGGWVPAAGALVELQVYARGSWRTFAQPRTDQTGRWRYQYRFETISRQRPLPLPREHPPADRLPVRHRRLAHRPRPRTRPMTGRDRNSLLSAVIVRARVRPSRRSDRP